MITFRCGIAPVMEMTEVSIVGHKHRTGRAPKGPAPVLVARFIDEDGDA